MLPLAPVERLMRQRYERVLTLPEMAEVLHVSVRSLRRFRAEGVPYLTADKMACAAGLHPWHVWGDDWWRDLWEPDEMPKSVWVEYSEGSLAAGAWVMWHGTAHRIEATGVPTDDGDTFTLDNGEVITLTPGESHEVPQD